jgi:TM2 domain-containing membrane protein YozV
MNPQMPAQTPPPIETPRIVGYCRACGKSLSEGDALTAQGTIYCKEHAPQEPPPIHATPPPISSSPYTAPYAAPVGSSPYASSSYAGQQIVNPGVSPTAAFVLGLIPGVGAIYNGQYAKGLVHAIILGILLTLANTSIPSIPEAVAVLLVITFWVYMPFEAYHTASRRRQGQAVDEFSGLAGAGVSSRFPVGAVLLIAFGVVFLLNNLDLLDLRRILRFWPVLMIGMGVYLLWARMLGGTGSGNGSANGGGQS